MPGHDRTKFVDISDDILKDILCGICFEVLNTPTITECCGQGYCKECIERWLKTHDTCPHDRQVLWPASLKPAPRVLTNLINNLKIRCEFNDCPAIVRLVQYGQHVVECPHNTSRLCRYCDEAKSVHDQSECYEVLAKKYDQLSEQHANHLQKVEQQRKEQDQLIDQLRKRGNELETNQMRNQLKTSLNIQKSPGVVYQNTASSLVGDIKWVKVSDGVIPSNAVSGGFDENGESLYVGRAIYRGVLMPGKVIGSIGLCLVSHMGKEHGIRDFDILTRPGNAKLSWVPRSSHSVDCIEVSNANGPKFQIGRAYYKGSMAIGKVDVINQVLFVTCKGYEITLNEFDVLTTDLY